jgi:Cytochrome C and Quinol oxidase polypeptide I
MSLAGFQRVPEVAVATPALEEKLHSMWESEPGLRGWLTTVDHKEIGIMYLVTAFFFLVAGGLEALMMRLQLVGPDRHLLTPEQYNQLFTMHGNTMIFWYAVPVLSMCLSAAEAAPSPAPTHGTPTAWNGPRHRRHRPTTSR